MKASQIKEIIGGINGWALLLLGMFIHGALKYNYYADEEMPQTLHDFRYELETLCAGLLPTIIGWVIYIVKACKSNEEQSSGCFGTILNIFVWIGFIATLFTVWQTLKILHAVVEIVDLWYVTVLIAVLIELFLLLIYFLIKVLFKA